MAAAKTSTVRMDDGVNIHAKLFGDDSSTLAKPLLIALHGAPGVFTHAEPETSFGHLSPIFRVLVFDARGSGASDMIGPYTHERWMKDIENLRYIHDYNARPPMLTCRGCGREPRLLSWRAIRMDLLSLSIMPSPIPTVCAG
jgi:predicted alpha/beta-fold hydrolase